MALPAATVPQAPEATGELRSGATLELAPGDTLAWLVPAGVMAHWQHRPAVWPLPGAPPALRGVVYWLGKPVPVFDMALWLAPDQSPRACEHIVLLALPEGPAGLRVRGAPDLVPLDTAVPVAAPAQAPELREFLRPRARLDGGVMHEFDVTAWLRRVGAATPSQPAPGAREAA
jgi:chemotaxis signal transduction protein